MSGSRGATRGTVALCVVARNESAFIRACVESALPVVDEAIVVDTGSVDGTPDLARRAGARVVEAGWPGDLGAAHNLPLAHTDADWILSLDGDEILDSGTRHLIPILVREADVDGFRLPIRNYSYGPELKMRVADARDPVTAGARCYRPTQVVRLHRRRPEVRHRGRLHQSLEPSILARGGAVGDAPVIIHHYGPLRFDRDKTDLYRILARRQVADTPHDARAWFDFGMLFTGVKFPGAIAAFRRAHALGLRGPAAFMIGCVLLDGGRPRQAARWLLQALAANHRDDSVHFDLADAWEALAAACEAMGHRRKAEQALVRALALRPDSLVAANNLGGLLIERGDVVRAERIVGRLLETFRGLSLPWSTLGVLRLQQRALEPARRAFETAVDINPREPGALVNLSLTHRLAGRPAEAARALRTAALVRVPATANPLTGVPAVRRPRLCRLPPGGVAHLAVGLQGGAGRVVVDAVRALRGRAQILLCADRSEYAGLGLSAEIEREGVQVLVVDSDEQAVRFVERLRPACVIDNGLRFVNGPGRTGTERWIAVGHAAVPMPHGYDAYVVMSRFHARFQRHLPPDRLHDIPNGVDLRRFRPPARRVESPVTIAALSRLDPGKFPRQLLACLPSLRTLGARLLIAGRGARRHEIEPEIHERGLAEVVRFVGVIPSAGVPAFLARAEVGLHLTEIDEENCSVAVLEMLASGLPIVSQPRGCLPEMVRHGENGYLASDPAAIAAHLAELVQSAALRARMGAASRRAAEPYRMERYRARMRRLVHRTCGDRLAHVDLGGAAVAVARPEEISLRDWRPAQTYLICCTPGSGGALLCEALATTGIAGFPRRLRLAGSDGRTPTGTVEESFERELQRELEDCATPNGVTGAMVFLPDLERLIARLGSNGESAAGDASSDLLLNRLPRLRLIRLTRRDRRGHALARLGADAGAWPLPAPARDRHATTVRAQRAGSRIGREMERVEVEEAAWNAWLARLRVPLVEVVYEDLAARRARTMGSVVGRLGIRVPAWVDLANRSPRRPHPSGRQVE